MISIIKYLSEQNDFPDLAALHSRIAANRKAPLPTVVSPMNKNSKEIISSGNKLTLAHPISSFIKNSSDN